MSKERQRARAAREAEQARAKAKAAKAAERKAKLERVTPSAPTLPKREPVYRQRRHAPLPRRLKAVLGLGWLATVLLILFLAPTWTGRVGLVVVATMAVALLVVITTDPTRRYR